MNRFDAPLDGKNERLPWDEAKGSDTPEMNAEVPDFMQEALVTRNRINARLTAVQDEEMFIKQLDCTGFEKKLLSQRLDQCEGKRIHPNTALRSELTQELDFVARLANAFSGATAYLATVYESYLLGTYRPDSVAREQLRALINERMPRGQGLSMDEYRRHFPRTEFVSYLRRILLNTAKEEREQAQRDETH